MRPTVTHLRRFAFTVVAMALIAGCARRDAPVPGGSESASPAVSPAPTGIRGRTLIDAGCPVIKAGSPCPSRPFAAVITVTRSGSGATVATVTTDSDGRFEVALPPGGYTLHPRSPSFSEPPTAHPVDIVVPPASYAEVTIQFDSGIR